MKSTIRRTNTGTTVDVSIPKAMRKQASSELASGFISGRKVHVRVHVPHDPFLLDYMLGLTEEFGLRIRETYGTAHTSKELTEAGAALYYATNFDAGGGRVGCYVIGEGKGPTISFLLAKLTDWDVVSIDPPAPGGRASETASPTSRTLTTTWT